MKWDKNIYEPNVREIHNNFIKLLQIFRDSFHEMHIYVYSINSQPRGPLLDREVRALAYSGCDPKFASPSLLVGFLMDEFEILWEHISL